MVKQRRERTTASPNRPLAGRTAMTGGGNKPSQRSLTGGYCEPRHGRAGGIMTPLPQAWPDNPASGVSRGPVLPS